MGHNSEHVGPHQEAGTDPNTATVEAGESTTAAPETVFSKASDLAAGAATGLMTAVEEGIEKGLGLENSQTNRDRQLKHNKHNYQNYFNESWKNLKYPEDLFQKNQVNGVAFYIQTTKDKADAVGAKTTDASSVAKQISGSASTSSASRDGPGEYDTQMNRSNWAQEEAALKSAGVIGAVTTGMAVFKGNGESSVGRFLNKAVKVAAGAAVAYAVAPKVADKRDKTLTYLQKVITMHVPQSIVTQYQADWNAEELGVAGAITNRRVNQTAVSEIGQLMGRGIIAGAANIPRGMGLGEADFISTINAASRKVNNPFKEQLFKSIGFRKFAFQYSFSPRSTNELHEVEQIIKTFKYYMHPDISPGQMFLHYPAEFKIEFLYAGEDGIVRTNQHLPKISSLALTDVKITYGPDGMYNTIQDTFGAASEITMELSFVELETLTANRIAEGY